MKNCPLKKSEAYKKLSFLVILLIIFCSVTIFEITTGCISKIIRPKSITNEIDAPKNETLLNDEQIAEVHEFVRDYPGGAFGENWSQVREHCNEIFGPKWGIKNVFDSYFFTIRRIRAVN
jgi:hypothetical protein